MFCKSCGNQIAAGETFCRVCGTPQAAPRPQQNQGNGAPQYQQQPNQGYAAPQYQQQPNQGYAAPQYQQPNQGYAAPQYQQPYAAPRMPKKIWSNERFSLFWFFSAFLTFLNFMFWFMPCMTMGYFGFDISMATVAEDALVVSVVFAVLLGLAGTALSLIPIIMKSVANPKWFWIPISTGALALYNFIFIFVMASEDSVDIIAFFGWLYMFLCLGTIALNVVLMGKSKRLF